MRTIWKTRWLTCSVFPTTSRDRVYYQPSSEGLEKRIGERLEEIKRRRSQKGNSRATSGQLRAENRIRHLGRRI